MSKKLTQEEFVGRAKDIYGEKYNYAQSEYTGFLDKVKIICNGCGAITHPMVSNHLQGTSSCKICYDVTKRMDQKEFVRRAVQIHGERYDYSQLIYQTSKKKIDIVCKSHGIFSQIASNHLKGSGCPKCNKEEMLMPKAEFIKRAVEMHGNKFGYERILYKNSAAKIEIFCVACKRYFWQVAGSHLLGSGCARCSGLARKTTEEFVVEAQSKHGELYNYSLANYINTKTKVDIICTNCGEIFKQAPKEHLIGQGCPACSGHGPQTKESFVKKSSEIHNNKYTYDKVVFVNVRTPVEIICPAGHSYIQKPSDHMSGHGCNICSKNYKNIEIFVSEAKSIHGEKYDYLESEYHNARTPVKIYCRACEKFYFQRPIEHITGASGCSVCARRISYPEKCWIESQGDGIETPKTIWIL